MTPAELEPGQVVVQDELIALYRVISVSGATAMIERFDFVRQRALGPPASAMAKRCPSRRELAFHYARYRSMLALQ